MLIQIIQEKNLLVFFDFLDLNSSIKSDLRNQNLSEENTIADFPDFLLANKNISKRNNQFLSVYSVFQPKNHWTINSFFIGNYAHWHTQDFSSKNFYNTAFRLEDLQKNKLKSLNILGKINSDYYIGKSSLLNFVLSIGVNQLDKNANILNYFIDNSTTYNENQSPNQFNLGQQLSFIQKLNKKSLLSLNAFYELKKNSHQYHVTSTEKILGTDDFYFHQNKKLNSSEYGIFAKYTLRLGKEMLYINTGINGLYQTADYFFKTHKKTDLLNRNFWFSNFSIARKKTNFEYGLQAEFRNYPKENISLLLPQALAKYHFKKDTHVIEAQYSRNVSMPMISDLNSTGYVNDFRSIVLQSMLNPNKEILKNSYEFRYKFIDFYHGIILFALSKYEQNQGNISTENLFENGLNYSNKINTNSGSMWINTMSAEKNLFKIKHKIKFSTNLFSIKQPMYAQGLLDMNTFNEQSTSFLISSNFKNKRFNYQLGLEVKNTENFTTNSSLKTKQISYKPQLHINWNVTKNITAHLQHNYHIMKANYQKTNFLELNYKLKYKKSDTKWHGYIYAENFTNLNGNELLSTIQQSSYIEILKTQRLPGFIGAGIVLDF